MNTEHIRVFRLAAELGSFTKAAEEHFQTQAGVSQQIRRLEQELGVQLFERNGRRVTLTEAGKLFLEFARDIDSRITELKRQLPQVAGRAASILIGSSPTPARYILPAILAEFHSLDADTSVTVVDMDLADIFANLLRGQLDFGVIGESYLTNDLEHTHLSASQLSLVVPRGHPLTHVQIASPEQVAEFKFIMLGSAMESHRLTRAWANKHGVSIKVIMESNSHDAIKESVRRGIGIAVVSSMSVSEELQSGELVAVRAPGIPINLNLFFARRRNKPLSSQERLLFDIVARSRWRSSVSASLTVT